MPLIPRVQVPPHWPTFYRHPSRERQSLGSIPACVGIFLGWVIPVTSKLALQWLPCQAPGVIGSALGLVGRVSAYCDWVRWKVWSATSISVWQHINFSEQIRPWDTLACCWDVKQPTNKQNLVFSTTLNHQDLHSRNCLVGLVVKASALRTEDWRFESRLQQNFSRSSHTCDLKIGSLVATLPGAWCYRVSTETGRPSVSILWLSDVESLRCNFYLSVAAGKIEQTRPWDILACCWDVKQPTNNKFIEGQSSVRKLKNCAHLFLKSSIDAHETCDAAATSWCVEASTTCILYSLYSRKRTLFQWLYEKYH